MNITSKASAQQRVDQIRSFQAELQLLQARQIAELTASQRHAIDTYHHQQITSLATTYDIDSNQHEKQLSLGLKIASFIGALAMAASVFFLFYQFWGDFSTMAQVAILVTAPVIGCGFTMVVARREKTGYFAKIAGLVTLSCFVLNLVMLGQIFSINPSPNAFLVWGLFAIVLAYATDARLLLIAGILAFAGFLSAHTGTWGGCYWLNFGERPENFFPAALFIFGLSFIPHPRFSGFEMSYRVFGMLLLLLPVLVLANWGAVSYLSFDLSVIEGIYQIMGFVISGGAIWLGVRKGWADLVNTGNVFFTIFLYTKFFDWWWDWMPKYVFFLVVGLVAIVMVLIFKRLRHTQVSPSLEARS